MTKPTIAIVTGAWHAPAHFTQLRTALEAAGFRVASAALPSIGSASPATASVAADAAFLRTHLLEPELARAADVVLLMHSYGGVPGSAAAHGLDRAARAAQGLSGAVRGLLYIAAILVPENTAVLDWAPDGQLNPWISVDESTGQTIPEIREAIFYNQTPDREAAARAAAALQPQALATFKTPSGPPAWAAEAFDRRRAYVVCGLDQCVMPPAQEGMLAGTGREWKVHRLAEADHSPFLDERQLPGLVQFVEECAAEWE